MKNTMKWLLLAAFMVAAMSLSAQQKPLKLGHIESSKLVAAMPEMAQAQKDLEAQQAEVQKESQNLRDQYQKLIVEYTQNQKTYSEIILASKEQEINELGQRIQKFEELAMNKLQKTREELFEPVMTKATNAITYIFDMSSGAILFASETSEDILPLVKKKLGIQ